MHHHATEEQPLIGAHISIAGGAHCALLAGQEIGATTIQIFTANQRQWEPRSISQEEATLFQETLRETGLSHIMSHSSYLINLGSPRIDVRKKSIQAFREEIDRCLALGISYLNIHPGAALDGSVEACLKNIVDGILSAQDLLAGQSSLSLLIENMAGQGSVVGATFEQLAYIVDRVKGRLPVGVCLDTCHLFAAGYDIRTEGDLGRVLELFDSIVGLSHLRAMHLNDSAHDLGSHKDRHSPIGEGFLGKRAFSAIMQDGRLRGVPKYLETPGGLEMWKREIAWLKRQIHGGTHAH